MTITRNQPALDETQVFERSAAANPRSRGAIRASLRQQEIRAGDALPASGVRPSANPTPGEPIQAFFDPGASK
jgi:hypothetical protein